MYLGNMSLEIYKLDPAQFLLVPALAWQAAFKKIKEKLDLLIDINMLLVVQKGMRGLRYMKDYDKNKELSYFQYWDLNNLYGWAMSQKLPVSNFKWIKDISQFNEDFIINYNEESDEGYFLEINVQYLEKLHEHKMICRFYLKE